MSSQKYIEWNAEFCTGCRLCEVACSMRFGNGCSPSKSAIRLEEETIRVCRQCSEPVCKKVCKFNAVEIEIDPGKCSGCGLCVSMCPYKSIFQSERKTIPYKCNLCGGQPECVSICPNGALSLARKGRWAAFFRPMQSGYRQIKNELNLALKTKINNLLLLMARERIIRMREGRKDTFLNRVVLTPMVKPFKKNFFSQEDND